MPLARAGFEEGYVEALNITWADTERGRGPTGTCIRTGETVVSPRTSRRIQECPVALGSAETRLRFVHRDPAVDRFQSIRRLDDLLLGDGGIRQAGSGSLDRIGGRLGLRHHDLPYRAERERAENEIRTLNAELEQRVIGPNRPTPGSEQGTGTGPGAGNRDRLQNPADPAARSAAHGLFPDFEWPRSPSPPSESTAISTFSSGTRDECLDVIVGDVMGKGIPAALLGAATKSHFLRALSDLMVLSKEGKLPEPKEIVMLAHAELVRHLIDLDSFVTLCYARLDMNRRSLDLVDCGHTGIVHLHGKTGLCEMLHGDNLPLGVREGEIYDQISVPFEPGDLLLFLFRWDHRSAELRWRAVWRGAPGRVCREQRPTGTRSVGGSHSQSRLTFSGSSTS